MTHAIPHPWEAILLVLAAYRLTRLAGWDEFPLAARLRAWVIGERWIPISGWNGDDVMGGPEPGFPEKAEGTGRVDAAALGLPGKQPSSEVSDVRPAYDRPTLAHLLHCPFCVSFYISIGVYAFWLWQPKWTLAALMPFVFSGVVGLISKNWDF